MYDWLTCMNKAGNQCQHIVWLKKELEIQTVEEKKYITELHNQGICQG